MENIISINPITRIEGHAKISIHLDENNKVHDARFHVVEFRGFEKFCEDRHFTEMPAITSRICGICPVSHLLAASKAGDAILGIDIPRPAKLMRELMHMGQIIQSHALSFFYLSGPDLLLGFDSDPATRNIMGLIEKYPDIALKGIRLRKFGQETIKSVAGRKIHSEFSIPGGVNKPYSIEARDELIKNYDEAIEIAIFAIQLIKDYISKHQNEVDEFAKFKSNYLGLIQKDGALEHYDGELRFRDSEGIILMDKIDPSNYLDYIAETTEDWSYLKFPFLRKIGYPEGAYRVGPLARLNIIDKINTPLANKEWKYWKSINGGIQSGSFYYHYARLIEILYGLERIGEILNDPDLMDGNIIETGFPKNRYGIGVIEAPRGTLFHHYQVDKYGKIEKVNLIISTGQNNLAMNRAVKSIAEKYLDGNNIQEGMLNRVEAAIRCYDPCLSCSTHAIGQMPIEIQIINKDGQILDEIKKG